jgi:hypothetical protein
MALRAFLLSMRAVRLDEETAERMLAGVVDPADAPPGYADVVELLERARSAAGLPVPAVSSARLGLVDPVPAMPVRRAPTSRRIPVLAAVAFCAMTGGAYAAGAAGAGSGTVSAVLDRIGVGSLVGASSGHHAAATPGTSAHEGEASAQTTGAAAAAPVGAENHTTGDKPGAASKRKGHGPEISKLARTTTAKGVDKGAQVSTAASAGKSHAGQNGNAAGGTDLSHPTHPTHPNHPSHPDHPSGGNSGSKKPGS